MVVAKKKEKDDGKEKKKLITRKEGEDALQGSPSFRIYFSEQTAAANCEDDPIKVVQKIKEERIQAQLKEDRDTGNAKDSFNSNEDSLNKQQKKERGRSFKSRAYSFLIIKNCYDPSHSSDETTSDANLHNHHQTLKS